MTTTPAAIVAASPAAVAAPPAPVARRPWGQEFAERLLGDGTPTAPASAPTALTYGRALGFAAFDGVEIGALGLLAGAAHRRGLLHPGVSGIVGLLALAASAPASVHSPFAGRALGNLGLAGIFAAAFTAGAGSDDKEKEPTSPATSPARGEDPIDVAARETDLL